jgi:hypothetical protein
MNRATFLFVAALFAAVALPDQLAAQSTNVRPLNTNQNTRGKSGIFRGSGNLIRSNATSSFIGGGQSNIITTNATNAVIGGGFGNDVSNQFGVVGGGIYNLASGNSATVGGGIYNTASGYWSTVSGGSENTASGAVATVGGGINNSALGDQGATVGGGNANTASGYCSTVSGGYVNYASNNGATVGGGAENEASGFRATVGGGSNNTASGNFSCVPGGAFATASHPGSFVYNSDNGELTASFGDGTFTVRCEGGARFYTANGGVGAQLLAGATAWDALSDSNSKTDFEPIKPREILSKVAALPVKAWHYKHDRKRLYIGPMAQDFHGAFGLGSSDKTISTLDSDGVMYAAIQGLVEELKDRDAKIGELEASGAGLKTKMEAMEERLNSLPPAR